MIRQNTSSELSWSGQVFVTGLDSERLDLPGRYPFTWDSVKTAGLGLMALLLFRFVDMHVF